MIKAISDIGLANNTQVFDVKQVKLTNWLAFLSIIVSGVYASAFVYYQIPNAIFIELTAMFFYALVLCLAYLKLFQVTRFLFIIGLFAHMVVRSFCYGEESQMHLLLIPIATIPIILYDLKQKATIVVLVLIAISAFMALYTLDFSSPIYAALPSGLLSVIRFTSYLTAISTQGIVMFEIISNYEKTEKSLDKSNELLQQQVESVFDNSYDALFLVDGEERKIIKANKRAVALFEMNSEEDFFNTYGLDYHDKNHTEQELLHMRNTLVNTGRYEDEVLYKTKKGNKFWGSLVVTLIYVGPRKYQSVRVTDITESKNAKAQIEASLNEKHILLAEIHHRVKNNMAIINGLLSLQANYADSDKLKEMFMESRNRIHSMALIHDKLYHTENFASIDFGLYIKELISQIESSYNTNNGTIKYILHCDNVFIDMEHAVPCGLILNEILSNIYKHAFPNKTEGEVKVICENSDKQILLTVMDNGCGFDVEKVRESAASLGLTLIEALVDQLEGSLKIENKNGTLYHISFKG